MTTMIRYEVEMTDVMLDRAKVACDAEGVTLTTFFESAIRDATIEAEKRSSRVAGAMRSAEEYPVRCLVASCPRRFMLKMHAVTHLKNSHPERYETYATKRDGESPEPISTPSWTEGELVEAVIPVVSEPIVFVDADPPTRIPASPEVSFKLGVDPKYIEMDEPRTDKSPERAHPDVPPVRDFLDDVPEL